MNCKWCAKPLKDTSFGRQYHDKCRREKERHDARIYALEYRRLHPIKKKPIIYDEQAFSKEWEEAKKQWTFREDNVKANNWKETL